jgi:hypothetical protein
MIRKNGNYFCDKIMLNILTWSGPDKWSPFVGKGLTTTLYCRGWILSADGDHPSVKIHGGPAPTNGLHLSEKARPQLDNVVDGFYQRMGTIRRFCCPAKSQGEKSVPDSFAEGV